MMEAAKRLLVFVAHPDDETIGCAGLLQRASSTLVVFAVDGAPAGYGLERRFGGLQRYSKRRFQEASRALKFIENCSIRRLRARDGTYFPDRRLFEHLEAAADSLLEIARAFLPDAIVSHAFEGGHIDHDACHFLARHAARSLGITPFEFPLYWQNERGQDVFQEFRNTEEGEVLFHLSGSEVAVKERMLSEYRTQRSIVATFSAKRERFRPVRAGNSPLAAWRLSYPGDSEDSCHVNVVQHRFAEFHDRTGM